MQGYTSVMVPMKMDFNSKLILSSKSEVIFNNTEVEN